MSIYLYKKKNETKKLSILSIIFVSKENYKYTRCVFYAKST